MNATWQRNLGILALMAATLTACSADPDRSSADPQSTPTSTGTASPAADAPIDPIVLRLGTGDAKDAPAADQIRYFAKRAGEVSGGAITVKPVWLAAGDVAHFETAMAQQAIDGDLDLALVASRAWDTVGVNSLTPLNAPFLVNTDELVSEVVSGPVQDELLVRTAAGRRRGPRDVAGGTAAPVRFRAAPERAGGLCKSTDPGAVLEDDPGHVRGTGRRDQRRSGRPLEATRRRVVVPAGACGNRHRQRGLLPEGQRARRQRRGRAGTARAGWRICRIW